MRRRATLRLWMAATVFALLAGRDLEAQTVVVEPEKKLIPGGPGRKPFDVTRHAIPLSRIQGEGPARDAIPALQDPQFVAAREAGRFLSKGDRVLGVVFDGVAKAYPVRILTWHELVNDVVGRRPALVSW